MKMRDPAEDRKIYYLGVDWGFLEGASAGGLIAHAAHVISAGNGYTGQALVIGICLSALSGGTYLLRRWRGRQYG